MADETVVTFDAPLFRSTLEKIQARAADALEIQLGTEAEMLLSAAQADVPVASGELKSSAFADVGRTERGNPAATVGYDAPYAAAVHEGFHRGHQSNTPHQFWLQSAANQFSSGFSARMAAIATKAVGN